MWKLSVIICFFIGTASAVRPTTFNINNLLWDEIEAICEYMESIEGPQNPPPLPIHLRIVEYTPTGYRNHSLWPSAATSLASSKYFDPQRPTVIFVHGFTSTGTSPPAMTVCTAYKQHGGYNVLALDSGDLIGSRYGRSATRVKHIGRYLGHVLYEFFELGIDLNNFHLVGHSLGAHISGFAGKAFYQMTSTKLPRITGLDPARPCFYKKDTSQRLFNTDADFVDVIHTNGGSMGMNTSVGHVDFYPDGGALQPGCPVISSCSHERAWEYYAESVNNPQNFPALRCGNWTDFTNGRCGSNPTAYMGYATDANTRGNYYLDVSSNPNYGKGLDGIKITPKANLRLNQIFH